MQIRVGPFRYRVELADGDIEHDGVTYLAVTDHDRRVIRVTDRLDDEDRMRVLIAELMEAWWRCYEGGEACGNVGGVMDAIVAGVADMLDQLAPMLSGDTGRVGLRQVAEALRLTGPAAANANAGRFRWHGASDARPPAGDACQQPSGDTNIRTQPGKDASTRLRLCR